MCVNYFNNQLMQCNNACLSQGNSCVFSCNGSIDCANQCSAYYSYCSNACRNDYSANVGGFCPPF